MFMTTAARHTLTVMGEQGIRRIVLASSQGAGDGWARLSPLVKAFIKMSNIKVGFNDHTGVDRVVRASSGIDWTLARAVALTDKPADGPVRAAEAGTESPARGSAAPTSPSSSSRRSRTTPGPAKRPWSGTPAADPSRGCLRSSRHR
jgi:hypothetical protein